MLFINRTELTISRHAIMVRVRLLKTVPWQLSICRVFTKTIRIAWERIYQMQKERTWRMQTCILMSNALFCLSGLWKSLEKKDGLVLWGKDAVDVRRNPDLWQWGGKQTAAFSGLESHFPLAGCQQPEGAHLGRVSPFSYPWILSVLVFSSLEVFSLNSTKSGHHQVSPFIKG